MEHSPVDTGLLGQVLIGLPVLLLGSLYRLDQLSEHLVSLLRETSRHLVEAHLHVAQGSTERIHEHVVTRVIAALEDDLLLVGKSCLGQTLGKGL